jgi:hypothetical protein
MGKEMRYLGTRAKNTLPVVLLTLVGLFLFTQGTGKMFTSLQPIQALQQNVVTACIDNSCQTVVCVDNQLCHSFRPNNDPATNEQPLDDTTTMQPIEENNADALQPSKHFFKSNGNPSVNGQPLDDTTTMQPIEENNADALQPSKDNMEIMTLMEKNIVH